jgi:hypothetical protein
MSSQGLPPGVPPGASRPAGPPLASPLPPPQKRNQAALWIVVILGSCLGTAIIAGLLLVRMFVHRLNVREAGNKVAIETPIGSINVNKAEAHATGLPVYPGATSNTENGGSVEIGGSDSNLGLATEEYRTNDPITKVREWYRHRLGTEFRLETGGQEHANHRGVQIDTGDHDAAFVDDHNDGARVVALDSRDGGTKITLLRIGKRNPQ